MIYFLIYLFLEVMVSSTISGEIGAFMTFLEIIFSVIIGMTILKNFKFSLMDKINAVKNGEITQDEFVKSSIGKAIGAVLLMIPGFFTDIIGILLQFGLFTMVFSKMFKFKPRASNNQNYSQTSYTYSKFNNYNQTKQKGEDDVIDVEVIDDNKSIVH